VGYKTYFRICLFIPVIIPLPLLLLKGAGFHSLLIATLVFGMPPYILFIALPLAYSYRRMTEKQVIISMILIPIVLPPIFGLFWLIVPHLIETVSVSFANHIEWISITFLVPVVYSSLFIFGNIIRRKIFIQK